MTLFRATFTVGGLTALSRIMGFIRDVLMARILGAGMIADCFVLAFKLPNFFRRLFAEGAFSAAFVPMFASMVEGEGLPPDATAEQKKAAAVRFAEEALAALFASLLLFVSLCQIFMPAVMTVLGAGFVDNAEKFDLAVALTRITFPYLLFISLVSLLGGILNALHRFAAVAFTPILLNLFMVGSLLFFSRAGQTPAHALAWGVSLSGVAQFVWLYVACRREGVRLRLRLPRLTPQVKKLLLVMMPVALGAGAFQVNLLMDTFLAGFLADGSLAFLYYADRLNQLPLGVIGIAVGTALLPMLSRQVAAGNDDAALHSQNRAIEMALFLTLPAAVALVVVPEILVKVLFEGRAFTPEMTDATAAALRAFALGLPAYVLAKVLSPGYFARKDTKTPVRYAMASLVVNLALNVALMFPLKHVGLALATATAAWVNAGLLFWGLRGRGYFAADARLMSRLPRILAASVFMGIVVHFAARLFAPAFAERTELAFMALAALVVGGVLAYGVSAILVGAVNRADLAAIRRP